MWLLELFLVVGVDACGCLSYLLLVGVDACGCVSLVQFFVVVQVWLQFIYCFTYNLIFLYVSRMYKHTLIYKIKQKLNVMCSSI